MVRFSEDLIIGLKGFYHELVSLQERYYKNPKFTYVKTYIDAYIKEKYGELRVYTSHMTDNMFNILEAYCAISRNVCIICGKLDVPMVNRGWISPYCRDCATKADIDSLEEYDDAVKDERKTIVTSLKFSTVKDGKEYPFELDISKYVKKVRDYNKE
jgi:hypothetical protein